MIKKGLMRLAYGFSTMALVVLLMAWSGISTGSDDAISILDLLTKRYNHLTTLVADFTQSFHSKALGRGIEEHGKLYIQIPGKMRWDYHSPEKKLAICNGSDTWLYIEEDNTVIKGNLDLSNGSTAILSLLSGRADLNKVFQGERFSKDEKETKVQIRLKERNEDFDYLIITVENKNDLIAEIEVIDLIGNKMIYSFHNIQENIRIDPKLFYFSIPPNARIKFESSVLE